MQFFTSPGITTSLGVMQIYRQELLAICHPPDKFCDHKYYDNGDLMFLICHVTSSEHMFKVLYEFTGGSPLP